MAQSDLTLDSASPIALIDLVPGSVLPVSLSILFPQKSWPNSGEFGFLMAFIICSVF
jgi:hypothetical protein